MLISELEKDNKNFDGIYKVRGFDKMYVVRPQTFVAFINVLKDSLTKNNELIQVLNQKKLEFIDQETFINTYGLEPIKMIDLKYIKTKLMEQGRSLDKGIMYGAFLLLFFGVFLTLAASPAVTERNHWNWSYFIIKHMAFVPVAVMTLLGVALLPLKWVRRFAFLILSGGIVGMIFVLLGPEIKGAHRWVNVFGFSVQPSEFVKPAFAVM